MELTSEGKTALRKIVQSARDADINIKGGKIIIIV